MERSKNNIFSTSLIMFGSAISIAEIITGTFLAPLGFSRALSAIIIGHLIGGILLYLAGVIGCNTSKSSMETTKLSFGKFGGFFFSSVNIISLVGWTSIMIISGAFAANSVMNFGLNVWSLIIAAFILVWVMIGINHIKYINIVAISLLLVLTVILSRVIFTSSEIIKSGSEGVMTFGYAVELSVAMPLSWLPLIADYTKDNNKDKRGALASTITYTIASIWMYVIGLGAAIYCGYGDIELILANAGLPVVAILIVIFSTVTTTFLDVYSAGISSLSLNKKLSQKTISAAVTIIGVLIAIFAVPSNFESFLYLLASFFTPMISIMIADHFFIKKDSSKENLDNTNLILWILGFIVYRIVLSFNTPLGITFPVMVLITITTILTNKLGENEYVKKMLCKSER